MGRFMLNILNKNRWHMPVLPALELQVRKEGVNYTPTSSMQRVYNVVTAVSLTGVFLSH